MKRTFWKPWRTGLGLLSTPLWAAEMPGPIAYPSEMIRRLFQRLSVPPYLYIVLVIVAVAAVVIWFGSEVNVFVRLACNAVLTALVMGTIIFIVFGVAGAVI